MPFYVLAEAVVVIHVAFVVFVVLRGLLGFRWKGIAWIHLPAVVWGFWVEWSGWVCPLTPLENWVRRQGGGASYEGGFVERYLIPILYPPGLTRPSQLALGTFVLGFNLLVYGAVGLTHRRRLARSGVSGELKTEHRTLSWMGNPRAY